VWCDAYCNITPHTTSVVCARVMYIPPDQLVVPVLHTYRFIDMVCVCVWCVGVVCVCVCVCVCGVRARVCVVGVRGWVVVVCAVWSGVCARALCCACM
jgi:hypothetical protein